MILILSFSEWEVAELGTMQEALGGQTSRRLLDQVSREAALLFGRHYVG